MGAVSTGPRRRLLRRPPRLASGRTLESRRRFLLGGAISLLLGGGLLARLLGPGQPRLARGRLPIRPPSADPVDATFRAACIGCGLCGSVCENGCIRFFGLDEWQRGAFTPYLDLRRRSCTLCMRCTQVCPTDALTPVADDAEAIAARVSMGVAVVDPDLCLSYLGRVCGYCHDACPYPERAIRLVPPAKPAVVESGCVGCGRCVELCPQFPTAIDVRREVA
jgi:ferredoxin